jgi:signal transduction histidine kinase
MTIDIKDNGNGFDMNEIGPFANGLRNMRNRIEQIGGRFRVESAKGAGTLVTIDVAV